MSRTPETEAELPLAGKFVSFVGKLGGMNRREAQRVVRENGWTAVDHADERLDLIIIGADELPLTDDEELLDEDSRQAAAEGRLEIISETEFWQRLGMVDGENSVRRLYTPAMLADLIGVSVTVIRRWHRRGLIVPAREVRRLPYFDFQEVSTARRLAQLLAAGASAAAVEKKLAELSRYVPTVERPLAQLSVIVEGQQLLLRQGEGLIEPGGQLRIDFDAIEDAAAVRDAATPAPRPILSFANALTDQSEVITPEELVAQAVQFEDEGQLEAAVDLYRASMTAGGPRAESCFQLAELLYRLGNVSAALERYFMAVELDEDYVEARANLGCVLAETGQLDLAVAAFQGALQFHSDYPDVHFHLARTLDELGQHDQAAEHWRQFLALTPNSPWADEARERLSESSDP